MVNLIELYKKRYYISHSDLADLAEANRLHLIVACSLLFIFGLGNLIYIFAFHFNNLQDYITSIIYFGVFTLLSIAMFFYSRWVKNVDREKAYVLKTIPFYVLLCTGISAAIYNCYFIGHPFNAVLTYCITDIIALMAFTFSPIIYFIIIVIGLAFLIPYVYVDFGVTGLLDTILVTILLHGFSLYRRFTQKKDILMLQKQKHNLEAKTFGNFTLFFEGKVVKFKRIKSNELVAYLIYKNGSSVQTKELISVLYGDQADSSHNGANLRNLISDIKHTFDELEIQNFFISEYNNFRINPEAVRCDYYDFLTGNKSALKSFSGEFMSQYSWAKETTGFLEMKALKK